MSLQLAEGYTRFDSSHIKVCDNQGVLHDNILTAIKNGKKNIEKSKPRRINRVKTEQDLTYEKLSEEMGYHKSYISKILCLPEDDEFYLYFKSINDDIVEAILEHHKRKQILIKRLKNMADEISVRKERLRFGLILIEEKYYSGQNAFRGFLTSIERGKNLMPKISSFLKAQRIVDRYDEYKKEL